MRALLHSPPARILILLWLVPGGAWVCLVCDGTASNKRVIREHHGVQLLMQAMKEHAGDALVQRNACWALWNLAAQSRTW